MKNREKQMGREENRVGDYADGIVNSIIESIMNFQ